MFWWVFVASGLVLVVFGVSVCWLHAYLVKQDRLQFEEEYRRRNPWPDSRKVVEHQRLYGDWKPREDGDD